MSSLFIGQRKWKSILSIVIFVLIVAVNFIVITFGMRIKPVVAVKKWVYDVATDISTKDFKIEDIYAEYTSVPQNRECNIPINATNASVAGLRYESLTPDVFVLTDGNTVCHVKGKLFDDNEDHIGILRVTSTYDKSFQKDIELTFYKGYAKDVKAYVTRYDGKDGDKYIVHKDSPFAFYYKSGTSWIDADYEYDSDYFERSGDKFIPLKTGETTITFNYTNYLIETFTFVIQDRWAGTSFDDVIVCNYPKEIELNPSDLRIGGGYTFYPVKDGNRQYFPISITSDDPHITIKKSGYFTATTAGTYTLSLISEYGIATKTVTFTGNVVQPSLSEHSLKQEEDGTYSISMYRNVERSIGVTFPVYTADTRLNFEYDSHDFAIWYSRYNYSENTLYITPKFVGTKQLTIVVGKGTPEESRMIINVNSESEGIYGIVKAVRNYLTKGASHIILFFLTGIAMVLLLVFAARKWPLWAKILFASLFSIVLGGIEELIQMTEPGRFPSAIDVFGYDLISYVVGMFLCWAVIAIISKCIFDYKKKKGIYAPYERETTKNE